MAFRSSLVGASMALCVFSPAYGQNIALITPYLSQPGTQSYVDSFNTRADGFGWDVDVVHTDGDVAGVIHEMENAVEQDVDAIVINVDPSQVGPGLRKASEAKIPVVGMDAGSHPLIAANITSNGYSMAAETAAYIASRIEGTGNVVMFTYDQFPPVQVRGVIADAVFDNYPDIDVIERITPDISDGAITDSRAKMATVLAANPELGSVSAVWAAWDQPALGALEAIEAAGRSNEGIVITGIDANPQARQAIAKGSNFEATVEQNFKVMGKKTADVVARLLAGETPRQQTIYVPAKLVTAEAFKG
ncbi:substrate-binding domain-containing protein [Ruegeria atlantica]|uniref:substrate-binding domain-containing protein n=1 Tax=Ruegeria atlantica TaxID=81569 RepID=UPI0014817F04|nr:substrate-binding domain-containing protein [Ruegeria atlantica]